MRTAPQKFSVAMTAEEIQQMKALKPKPREATAEEVRLRFKVGPHYWCCFFKENVIDVTVEDADTEKKFDKQVPFDLTAQELKQWRTNRDHGINLLANKLGRRVAVFIDGDEFNFG